jgi:hypothetical protein
MTDFSVVFNTEKGVTLLDRGSGKNKHTVGDYSFQDVMNTAIKNPLGIVAGGIKAVRQYFNKEETPVINSTFKFDSDEEELMQMISSLERRLKNYKERKG